MQAITESKLKSGKEFVFETPQKKFLYFYYSDYVDSYMIYLNDEIIGHYKGFDYALLNLKKFKKEYKAKFKTVYN